MSFNLRVRTLGILSGVAILFVCLGATHLTAQDAKGKKAPAAKAEPNKARQVLDKMAAFYGSVKSLQVKGRTTMKMNMQGMNMDMTGVSAIAAERPNKFSSVSQGQGMMAMAMSSTTVSDGKTVKFYMPMMKQYTEREAPEKFSGLAGNNAPTGGGGADAFIIGLLSTEEAGASLFEGIDKAEYIGLEDMGGAQSHHLRLTSDNPNLGSMGMGGMTLDMWVDAGEKPYMRRIQPDFKGLLSQLGGGGVVADPNAKACQENLIDLAGRKEQWALEKNAKPGDKISASALEEYLEFVMPKCPSGKGYVLNPIGQNPVCLSGLEGHDLASAEAAGELEGIEGLEGLDVGAMFEGMEMEISFDYSDWQTDGAIPAETFVFTPPEGAMKTDDLFADMGLGDFGGTGFGATEDDDPAKKLEGQPAPTFKLKIAGGGEFELAAHTGKNVVILDFWASWCGPCRKSMPSLIKIAKEYAGKGVVFVPINLEESEEDVLEFIKKEGWDVKTALDLDYAVGEKYMAEAIPETVVIGKDGTIAMVHVGASEAFDADLREKLDELLGGEN